MLGNVVVLPLGNRSDRRPVTALGVVGQLMTFARIPLGCSATLLIVADQWGLAVGTVLLFVVLDLLDGRFARAGGISDTARRRAVDATVDKLSVHACALAACLHMPEAAACWVPLLVRDAVQTATSLAVMARLRAVVAGAWWHRFFSLSVALWGVTMLLTRSPAWPVAVIAFAVGIPTLWDYCRQCGALVACGLPQTD
jgi:phosphatidylglycerophosphate synthase